MLKESSDLSSTVSYFAAAPMDAKVLSTKASKQRTWPTLCSLECSFETQPSHALIE